MLKTSTAHKGSEIQWTPWTKLTDMKFTDDLVLLSHTQHKMQEKTSTAANNSTSLGLNVSKVPKSNTAVSMTSMTLDGNASEEVINFTYPGNIVDKQVKSNTDVKVKIGRARMTFLQNEEHLCII